LGNRCAVNASGGRLQFGRFKLASWVELIVMPVGSWQVIGLFVGQRLLHGASHKRKWPVVPESMMAGCESKICRRLVAEL
jgi:hypothetical protein